MVSDAIPNLIAQVQSSKKRITLTLFPLCRQAHTVTRHHINQDVTPLERLPRGIAVHIKKVWPEAERQLRDYIIR
jgi:hypothetical protein